MCQDYHNKSWHASFFSAFFQSTKSGIIPQNIKETCQEYHKNLDMSLFSPHLFKPQACIYRTIFVDHGNGINFMCSVGVL